MQAQVGGSPNRLTLFSHLRILDFSGETERPIRDSNTECGRKLSTAPPRVRNDSHVGCSEVASSRGSGQLRKNSSRAWAETEALCANSLPKLDKPRAPSSKVYRQVLLSPGEVYLGLQDLFPSKLGQSGSESPRLCIEWMSSVSLPCHSYGSPFPLTTFIANVDELMFHKTGGT